MVLWLYRIDWWGGCEYVLEDIGAVVWDVGFWGAGECHLGFSSGKRGLWRADWT